MSETEDAPASPTARSARWRSTSPPSFTGMINAAAELHDWAPDLTAAAATDHCVRPPFQGLLRPSA